ncbi:MAG: DUF4190 domain-containing protein [Sedimentisphaeraceae bacterium JB056]
MYCPKCGTLNPEGDLCIVCNWVLRDDRKSTTVEVPAAESCGLATASKVLGILGFFTLGLTFLPAFICGMLAILKIERSSDCLKGKGNAIFGMFSIYLATPVIALLIMVGAVVMPFSRGFQVDGKKMICQAHLKDFNSAIEIYVKNNHGRLPQAYKWCDQLMEISDLNALDFKCFSFKDGGGGYAMNIDAAGKKLSTLPGKMVLVFEGEQSWNNYGGVDYVNLKSHNMEGCNILYCDGTVEFVAAENIQQLIWEEPEDTEDPDAEN